ncbi:hypothetical protein DFJ66_5127 [Saccharothrix variisporea]|uniref:NADH:flavin oxidoreductase/NADH oxidase family protein n=1 Tax=Saccharothrix variisporea TaxID=543527 RepID=A0A495XBH9_9PSEU|nr:hypothetical protein DFJ66_5127 [Saccharothrix variisporea]
MEITDARQAEAVLADGAADLVPLGRELLRDPYRPLRAATEPGVQVTSAEAVRQGVLGARVKGRAAGGTGSPTFERVWMRQRR